MSALIILTLVCALTYTFEIVFGLAGTILMLPLLSFLYDAKTLVIYSVLPQILVAVIGLVRSPKEVNRKFMTGMLFFAGLGAIVGFALFYYFSASVFQVLLASAITAAGLFLVIAPHRARFNPVGMRVMDTLAGTSQAAVRHERADRHDAPACNLPRQKHGASLCLRVFPRHEQPAR